MKHKQVKDREGGEEKKTETKRLIVSTNYINLHASDREKEIGTRKCEPERNGKQQQVSLTIFNKTTTTSCNNKCRIRAKCANENKLYKIPYPFADESETAI